METLTQTSASVIPAFGQSFDGNAASYQKMHLNHRRNRAQDKTEAIDECSRSFNYNNCKNQFWNPEKYSLLYGTKLWEQASPYQRIVLNQLYWVAYYSQIISAEIATIYFNQTSAAGLYSMDEFRIVCDNLDLESAQERAHISAFRHISEGTEHALFGERIFTYPMRSPFVETMIFNNANRAKRFWKSIQLRAFGLLSSGNAFIGCQYFTVRGIRTLNGKLVQHQLSHFYSKHPEKDTAPAPSEISYYHFLDESFHFNTSMIVGQDIVKLLPKPTSFEKNIVNRMIEGCQKDHSVFSTAINGIFWYDPALFSAIYKILRSQVFNMDHREACEMLLDVFGKESDGMHESAKTHQTALNSYKAFVGDMDYISKENKEMKIMSKTNFNSHLAHNHEKVRQFIGSF